MFFQPPDEALNNCKTSTNPRRKRKRALARKKKYNGPKKDLTKKKHSRFAITMSSWAETFTSAATWQLKHQIAYWKSKAIALEYENRILHEIIRKNVGASHADEVEKSDCEHEEVIAENDDEGDGSDIEVSEEFIQFLTANAKYKEEARKERDKLKAAEDCEADVIEEMEAGPSGVEENKEEVLKSLYGERWQRISALETSLQSQFINACDTEKPMYWPNIPFNFNFN